MRFSAISSRVKSCVSSSTLDGSLVTAVGRGGAIVLGSPEELVRGLLLVELHLNMLPMEEKSDDDELGTTAGLRDSARSLSTAAFTL